jgi:hypothetical protein
MLDWLLTLNLWAMRRADRKNPHDELSLVKIHKHLLLPTDALQLTQLPALKHLQRLLCQYLYFCTSKASKPSGARDADGVSPIGGTAGSIKARYLLYWYFCTSKASKPSGARDADGVTPLGGTAGSIKARFRLH